MECDVGITWYAGGELRWMEVGYVRITRAVGKAYVASERCKRAIAMAEAKV